MDLSYMRDSDNHHRNQQLHWSGQGQDTTFSALACATKVDRKIRCVRTRRHSQLHHLPLHLYIMLQLDFLSCCSSVQPAQYPYYYGVGI